MKKVNSEFLIQLFLGVVGFALMIVGIIVFGASFFKTTPFVNYMNGIVIGALGAILFSCVKIYFMFLETITIATDGLKQMSTAAATSPQSQYNGRTYTTQPGGMSLNQITIDENTSLEEIELLKKQFPMFADSIEEAVANIICKPSIKKEGPLPKTMELLSLPQLEAALKKAVDSGEYEKAAEIRDEINKRKV